MSSNIPADQCRALGISQPGRAAAQSWNHVAGKPAQGHSNGRAMWEIGPLYRPAVNAAAVR
jgi:hypothetical protein